MTLEQLQEQSEKDLKINDALLDDESLRTPIIHNKYLQYHNQFSLLLRKVEYDYAVLLRNKWEYYTGKASPEIYKDNPFDFKILKSDIPMYLDCDEDLIKIKQKKDYYKVIINYLDQIIRSLNTRTFHIKSAIEWKKFSEGV